MTLSAMASLLLGHGSWPILEAEAVGVIERYFLGKSDTLANKEKLMRRLGVVAPFTVAVAREHAITYARAALAELQSEGLIESREDRSFRDFKDTRPREYAYSKTETGRKMLAELAVRGRLAGQLQEEGWP